ncbi:putative small nuclear ribonucleoprotein E [Portunus trituberculatus]|uniref:Small nuclear ribonucleoprotein E n=1 Tax=Portunus trituberculatus TaxID=210409 RepID=A0A5B7DDU4_PORTR|nr:putative small nuclear ribonucleoprotein E [Portunus trituberculatus]
MNISQNVQNLIFRYLQSRARVQIWLYENQNLRIEGHIIGFDEYMNVMLDQAEEVQMKKGTRKTIGKVYFHYHHLMHIIYLPRIMISSSACQILFINKKMSKSFKIQPSILLASGKIHLQ